MAASPITLVYIASTGHSGSTLLELLLNAHSRAIALGEFARYRTTRTMPCSCGAKDADASAFWHQLQQQLDARVGLPLGEMTMHEPASPDFQQHTLEFLEAMRHVTGQNIFIDATKSPKRLRGLMQIQDPRLDLRPIFLLRQPHGVIYSNMKKGRPLLLRTHKYSKEMLKYAWTLRHKAHHRMRYERLCEQPWNELERLMHWLDLSIEAGQLQWRDAEHHTLGGNRMRKNGDNTIRLDEKWRRELSLVQRWAISTWTWPLLTAIGKHTFTPAETATPGDEDHS